MFYSIKFYLRDLWIAIPAVLSVLIQGFLWWYAGNNIHPGLGQIFLHYNIIFGMDLIGDWWRMFLLPAAGLLVFFLDYLISYFFYAKDKFLSRLLSFWVIFFHIFLLIGTVLLVRLNI